MKVLVSGQNINVGASLSEYVQEAVENAVAKYFDQAIEAQVVFTKEAHLFTTDIVVNEGTGTGVSIKANAQEVEVYTSFDKAVERVEKQLRRYKRRLKNHHKVSHEERNKILETSLSATKYVLTEHGQDHDETEQDGGLIVAEKPTRIDVLTVSDAVMHMNLSNLPALVFINKKTGCVNVVYHRKDGNISWVESSAVAQNIAENVAA